ncbi:LysM peptidoglycan-binding domain-containing protein [Opitutus sp. GAS368]|uniref:LysM peptidoglycan-binding domain-containing protein n=1 Tax=Opitutus sp. GAS368 TaxID=1882749 RepID=UPI00087BDD42|nr:LysM peptidoglycan-binding domain-containing protein [Opitutus sp. GAS368]SDS01699.1 Chromosome segregation ATPase [Opitutus sp. GAS368]
MKIFRSLAAVLFVFALGLAAHAQESSEVTGLRAKAVKGNGIAQYNLGLAYAQGRGIAADQVEAFVWLSLARENGARGRALDTVIGSLDKATIELATQRLAERKTALGVHAPAATAVRAEVPVEAPAVVAPPAPGAAIETRGPSAPAVPAGEDSASATLKAERDALAVRVNNLSGDLAELRGERDRLTKLAADNEKAARTAETRLAELARATEATKAELAQTRQALAAKPPAPKPVVDTAALDAKSRELQAAQAELEAAKNFGRQVEDTLNKVNDDRARVAASAAAELEAARNFGHQVEDTLNKVNDQKTALEAQLAAAKQELAAKPAAPAYPDLTGKVAELETALAAARNAAPKYPDLRARVTELEAQFASQSAEAGRTKQEMAALAKAKDDAQAAATAREQELARANTKLAGDESAFAAVNRELAAAKSALAAKPTAPAYPDLSGRVSELEAQLTKAKQPVAPAYPDLRANVAALEEQLAVAKQSLAAKPAYPDLRSQVGELETKLAAANSAASGAQQQIAALAQAKANAEQALAAKPAAPAYPDLSGRVRELEAALTTARNATPAYPNLSGKVAELEATLAQTSAALAAKPAAPSYPDLSGRVRELETALTVARNAAPAYPNLSGRVAELESNLSATSAEASRARQEVAALTKVKDDATSAKAEALAQVATLTQARQNAEQALAAKPAAPAYPDLSGRVSELEKALADSSRQLVAAQSAKAAPAYPDLSGRVTELEGAVATALQKFGAADQARTELARQFDDYKSATATAARERTTLQSNLKMLESDKVALRRQVDAATAESNQLRTQVATLKAQTVGIKPAAPAYPDLSGKVAELQAALAAKPAAPSYPDLSGRVSELEAALTTARNAAPAYPNLSDKVSELETKLAASAAAASQQIATLTQAKDAAEKSAATKSVAPVYPDLRDRVASLESDLAASRKALAAKPAAPSYPDLSGRVTELEAALTTARNAKPAYPNLTTRVAELETQLAAKPAAPSYPDLSGRVNELEAALTAARNAAPAYPNLSGKVAELEASLAQTNAALAAKPAAPSYPDLSGRVTELEAALTTARNAAPAYPNLSDKVSELETKLAASAAAAGQAGQQIAALTQAKDAAEKSAAALSSEATSAKQQVAALTKAKADKPAAPAYPDLSGKVADLTGEVTQLRADRERMQKMLADSGRQLAEATAATRTRPVAPPGYADRMRALETTLAATKQQLAAAQSTPAYPDLSGKVTELETKLATAEKSAAEKSAAPAYPDLSGKVAELTSEVSQLRIDRERMQQVIATAGRQMRDTTADSTRIKDLETQLAALASEASRAKQEIASLTAAKDAAQTQAGGIVSERDAARTAQNELRNTVARLEQEKAQLAAAKPLQAGAPAYPDLTNRVRELETQLTRANAELSAAGPAKADLSGRVSELEAQLAQAKAAPRDRPAPAYPDLSGRVRELETALAQSRQQLATAQATPAPAPAAAGDTGDLAKKLADTEDRLATSLRGYAALQRERDALADSAGKSTAAVTAERDSLATQVASLNGQVEQLRTAAQNSSGSTQVELNRLNESVAALQRTSTQSSRDLAAARALAQQLQGANSVLAGENYQLKTMLSRTTGSPTTAPVATPVSVPGVRTHVVASGDSLSRISQRYYGTANRWQEIYNANATLLGPNGILKVGTELRIP